MLVPEATSRDYGDYGDYGIGTEGRALNMTVPAVKSMLARMKSQGEVRREGRGEYCLTEMKRAMMRESTCVTNSDTSDTFDTSDTSDTSDTFTPEDGEED